MVDWKLSSGGRSAIRDLANGAQESRMTSSIPPEELAAALPADPVGIEESINVLRTVVQMHLDATVKERGYDDILTACSYATDKNVIFRKEGTACLNWRSEVRTALNAVVEAIKEKPRSVPTAEELIAELPTLLWP